MAKKERALTPAEQKRKTRFEQVCAEMEQNGYQKRDLTIGVIRANGMAVLIMLPFAAAAGWLYASVHPSGGIPFSSGSILALLAAFFVLAVVHEGIHGLTWGLLAETGFRAISFGVIWKALTPYCTCQQPLKKWQYILGGLMPTLVLGFGLAIAATAAGRFWLFLLAECLIFGGGGDFYIIWKLLRYRPQGRTVLCYDHPYECGLVVFEK